MSTAVLGPGGAAAPARSLARKLGLALTTGLALVSVLFLALFVLLYREQLAAERARAAAQVTGVLRIALENAMLKRDLEGLARMVEALGREDGVARVVIAHPSGEVRFASEGTPTGLPLEEVLGPCPACLANDALAGAAFLVERDGRELLRQVTPVANQPACAGCHGAPALHPVNGILIVDHDASELRRAAAAGALALSGAGGIVLALALAGLALLVRRLVLRPLAELGAATRAIGAGRLEARVRARGGDELAALGHAFDSMAERLEASFRLVRASERTLQAILDAIPDGIRVITDDFRILHVNRAYRTQLGLDEASPVVGGLCHASSHGREAPCPVSLVTCPVRELTGAATALTCRQAHRRADGGTLEVEIAAAAAMLEVDGRPRRVVVEAIRDLHREMRISHEQRLSELGMLAAGVAHEIRNPLGAMRLIIGGLERGPAARDPALAEELALLGHEIDACIAVTERLLRLAVPPSERPELVALDRVVPEVLSLLAAEAELRRVRCRLELEPDLRVIATDSELRMLVLNLAQNAFHAMPRGGDLTVRAVREGGEVRLDVIDTGVGIALEDRPRIFDPFWSRRADGERGTGLGLGICRAIVSRYGGRILFESEVGRGSRFTVLMPAADAAEGA